MSKPKVSILINDGSTDCTLSILKEYAQKDNRIIIIDKKNSGYGYSMNQGLKRANGEYIGIVESDDFIEPDMFEKLYTAAIDLFGKRLLRRVKKLAYHPTLYMIGYYFKKFKNLYLGENNAT